MHEFEHKGVKSILFSPNEKFLVSYNGGLNQEDVNKIIKLELYIMERKRSEND